MIPSFFSIPLVGFFLTSIRPANRTAPKNRRAPPKNSLIHQGRAFPTICGIQSKANSAILAIAKKIKNLTPTT
ncbi:hypothetical protein ACFW0H_07420 [Pseudomonas sp. CR3202]|uniref:hypothetical protein n=1 Tax=Pseudomonas sp. CR3202 TaxID=3351532 RepID=UPI003BF22270